MIGIAFALLTLLFIAYQIWYFKKKKNEQIRKYTFQNFPASWRTSLRREVLFYTQLSTDEQRRFEKLIQQFLAHCDIQGVKTEITDFDRLLIASAAVIPLFHLNYHFGAQLYPNLDTVLLYPTNFSSDYQIAGKNRNILGMVGNRELNRAMILSRQSLHSGFKLGRDGRNTAIHEFVHLIDGWDGRIDGIPEALMKQPAIGPWLELIKDKTLEIKKKKSDIDAYAASKPAEFLAVTAELYFENPHRMMKKHPRLFSFFRKIFPKAEAPK